MSEGGSYVRREINLEICEHKDGLIVKQSNRAYLARRWRLTENILSIFEIAINAGLTNFVQNGHPQESKLLPNGNGADYLTFSNSEDHRWIFVLDMDSCPQRSNPKQVKFNKKFKHILRKNDVVCLPEWRSPQELIVAVDDLPKALMVTKPYWNSLGKKQGFSTERGKHDFFVDEEDLHSHIVQNWTTFPLASTLIFMSSKHLIGSAANRIGEIDILAHDHHDNIFIVELKNKAVLNSGGETPDQQIKRYMTHPDIRNLARANNGKVFGILIAQDIDLKLRNAIRISSLPIVAYEATKTENCVKLQEVSRPSINAVPLK